MLRITSTAEEQERVILRVEGWIMGSAVELLREEGAKHLRSGRCLVLDLGGVRFIDPEGLALLEEWSATRIELCNTSPFIQMLLQTQNLQTGGAP